MATRNEQVIFGDIFTELRKAEAEFPGWPDDVVHGSAIVAEEAGELVQAALDRFYGRCDTDNDIRTEAVQTAAMAIRFLLNLKGGV